MHQKELFYEIKGYPAYRVSNYGYIESRWKIGNRGSTLGTEWKRLIPGANKKGYLHVMLCNGKGNNKCCRIHKLVALYFLGKPPKNKPVVRHLDGNNQNNNVSNLSYGSYAENEKDKILHGIDLTLSNAKLTWEIVEEIRRLIKKEGRTDGFYAKKYSVSRTTITRIKNNVIWKK